MSESEETVSQFADRLSEKVVDTVVDEINKERDRANRHLSNLGRLHPLTLLLIRFYNRTHGLPENEEITVSKELLADYGTGGVIIPTPGESTVTFRLVDKAPEDYADWSLIDEFVKLQAATAKEEKCEAQPISNQ